jgi:hypothetical protein
VATKIWDLTPEDRELRYTMANGVDFVIPLGGSDKSSDKGTVSCDDDKSIASFDYLYAFLEDE